MNRKIILGSYFGVLIIIAIIVVILYLIERENSMPVLSDDFQDIVYELTLEEMELTEEQYQLLRDSLLHVDHMNAIRRRNAWLILNEIREIEFVENRCPDRSNVGDATWILDIFGVGEIKELSTVRIKQVIPLEDLLLIRILNTDDNIYYLLFHQTWGLWEVTKESENGEIIYSTATHIIEDGVMRELDPEVWIHWRPPLPALCSEE